MTESPSRLARYRELLGLLLRHRGATAGAHPSGSPKDDESTEASDAGSRLATDLEEMGATYVKLGQFLSTRPDLLAPQYTAALARLQDEVEPFPFDDVRSIIEEDLGTRLTRLFEEFEERPLAAASLGQVHRARLRDGRPVVVKVLRPGARAAVRKDLEILDGIAAGLEDHTDMGRRYAVRDMLAQFGAGLLRELDYEQEATNMRRLAWILRARRDLVVPLPVEDYCTSRVLTMEYVRGHKLTDLRPLVRVELDGGALAEELTRGYMDQVLVEGFFHADPHPGNVFLTHDHKIALIDVGMVGRLDPQRREELLQLLLAVSGGEGREAAGMSIRMGTPTGAFEEEAYIRDVADLVAVRYAEGTTAGGMGSTLIELVRIAGTRGLRPLAELTLLGKTLLQLDEIARTLDPSFEPAKVIHSYVHSLARKQMLRQFSPSNLLQAGVSLQHLITKAPDQVGRILEHAAENRLQVRLHAMDVEPMLAGLHRIANRIAVGLLLAALIVGAALTMRVPSSFTLLGYPGLSIILFLAAALGAIVLLVRIALSDRKARSGRGTPR